MAAQLAGQGATVVCTARTAERAQEACAAAEAAWEGGDVLPGAEKGTFVPLALDHADLASVRAAGEEIAKRFPKVHQLHCNAGVMGNPFGRTKDGFEQQWCINHLSHHLLLQILLPCLKKAGSTATPARVLMYASCSGDNIDSFEGCKRPAEIAWDDPNLREADPKSYDPGAAYSQAKLAQILSAKHASELYGPTVIAVSMHPMSVLKTGLSRHFIPVGTGKLAAVVKTVVEYVFRLQHGHWFNTGFEAIQTPMHCALSSEVVPGAYYSQTPAAYLGKGWIEGEWPMEVPNATINDPAAPAKLWALTEKELEGF